MLSVKPAPYVKRELAKMLSSRWRPVEPLNSREKDTQFHWVIDESGSARNHEEFASRGKIYQTCLIFSSRLREVNFSSKFRHTRGETSEQTAPRSFFFFQLFPHVCGRLIRRLTIVLGLGSSRANHA